MIALKRFAQFLENNLNSLGMGEFKILLKREFKEKLNRLTKKNVNVANIIFNILFEIFPNNFVPTKLPIIPPIIH